VRFNPGCSCCGAVVCETLSCFDSGTSYHVTIQSPPSPDPPAPYAGTSLLVTHRGSGCWDDSGGGTCGAVIASSLAACTGFAQNGHGMSMYCANGGTQVGLRFVVSDSGGGGELVWDSGPLTVTDCATPAVTSGVITATTSGTLTGATSCLNRKMVLTVGP
jgi:hypothetical protein